MTGNVDSNEFDSCEIRRQLDEIRLAASLLEDAIKLKLILSASYHMEQILTATHNLHGDIRRFCQLNKRTAEHHIKND